MAKGISIFVGMDYSLRDNLKYMKLAKQNGFEKIFTSLHIPEADYQFALEEFKEITMFADSLGMKVTADISPRAFSYINADMNNLKVLSELKIDGIRVDFGFTPQDIAVFTRNSYGLKIEINASTVTENFLKEFEKYKPNYKMLQASHNYYPRLNTGISVETMIKKNNMLKKYNIEVSAFIPSLVSKRGPIYEGLPTLEMHRFMKPDVAAKHLYILGIDNVFLGDSIASIEELKTVGILNEKILEFNIELLSDCETEKKIIFNEFHINRLDSAQDVVRSMNSRMLLNKDSIINPNNNTERKLGYITIDNKDYLRYCGELQICKKDLPKDSRVNVVGKIFEEERFLINYIDEETKFGFKT
ncbi:MupG family TIM beta-alpha barrel fold protein [Clostridium aestuarii]|uniref:MupG family TIM beta-alpha barrel fold protein n=1 Tax=Clostridium aestuarii TaxID=338193 RepID=A0ABT4D5J1_9CLOT|nr:MupG family TIM beta-alpha barrel fold protein [Clostridium aestuarii]MCY6485303.1 MupG family TIM beta-alpha barrel fold protein [Clostridium aestuarii]